MVIGAISPAEAAVRAGCAPAGLSPAECDQRVAQFTVNGQVCDGDIVQDATGKRCVPRAVEDAVAKQRAAALGTQFQPLTPSGQDSMPQGALLKVGAAAVVGVLVVWGLSKVLA
jgi:hypothetical protein